jgi:phytoene dehydrogenase-like protein
VVGSGPNGLAAAIELARNRQSVLVLEAASTPGGGLRSEELTLPGFVHDPCSAVLALTSGSPFLSRLPLREFGMELVQPELALAHPFDDGSAAVLDRSVDRTAEGLGRDAAAYRRLMGPNVAQWRELLKQFLGPLHVPRRPLMVARFGVAALLPAAVLARIAFRGTAARALLAGMSSHAILPLERPPSAAFGIVLGMLGHAVGFPIARGGSGRVAQAMVAYLDSLGGTVQTDVEVASMDALPDHRAAVLDLTPRQVLRLRGTRFSTLYRRQLARFRYGPGVCKVDWALDGPIPWTADACRRAGTVHLGGPIDEIASSERASWRGEHHPRPFVILVQPTIADPSRASVPGLHTAWGYCHVPHGSQVDISQAIENQIERFAPGFGERILRRHVRTANQMEAYDANYVGGDINGGVQDLGQLFTRPTIRPDPYETSDPKLFICSSSTPPGGGVHGMCGYHAARALLRRLR